MAEDLHAIRRDAELERLDREWDARRQNLMIRNKDGSFSPPVGGMIPGIIATCFGVLWTIFATGLISLGIQHGAPGFICVFPLFGLLFITLGIYTAIKGSTAGKAFAEEQRQYLARRQELLATVHEESTSKG